MASTYTPISTTTLASPATSVTFSSISGSYTDLILIVDYGYSSGSGQGYLLGQVGNGSVDTGSNYSFSYIVGNGSSATSARSTNTTYFQFLSDTTVGNRAMCIMQFANYSNTNTYKSMIGRNANAAETTTAVSNLWRSTSAINTIKVYEYAGKSFSTGSTFTLYGIKAA